MALALTFNHSASSAVLVRFAYIKTFKDPDFLCEYLAYLSISETLHCAP